MLCGSRIVMAIACVYKVNGTEQAGGARRAWTEKRGTSDEGRRRSEGGRGGGWGPQASDTALSEPQGRLKVRPGGEQGTPPSQIQPWYHIRCSHEAYGMTLAASTGYM